MTLSLIKNTSDQGLVDAALEIAKRRRNTLLALKTAIRARRLEEADQLITQLVPDNEKNDSTIARFDRRAGSRR